MTTTTENKEGLRAPLLTTIKTISFIVLSVISISLSVYLFLQFSGHPVEQILFGALAVAFEGSKLYALVDGHGDWVKRKYIAASGKIAMYVLLAALSIIASYGFSLGALQRAELDPETERSSRREQQLESQIEEVNEQIEIFQEQRTDLPEGWVTASQRLQESIGELVDQRTDLYDELNAIEPPDFDLAGNAFILIGESIDMDGERVMFLLLIILAISIELCIIFTSPSVPHPDALPAKVPDEQEPEEDTAEDVEDIFASYITELETERATLIAERDEALTQKTEPVEQQESKEHEKPTPEKTEPAEEPKPEKTEEQPQKTEEVKDDPTTSISDIPKRSPQQTPRRTKDGLAVLMSRFVDQLVDNTNGKVAEPEKAKRKFIEKHAGSLNQLNLQLGHHDLQTFVDKLWKALTNLKGPTGYVLIDYHEDTDTYVSNYTPHLLKAILAKKIRGSETHTHT